MLFSSMINWLRRTRRTPQLRPIRRRRGFRPQFEFLEDRLAPAVVTVTASSDDVTPNDGSVSLREAITSVNAGNDLGDPNITAQNPGTFGTADTINFNINGAGVHTINVGTNASAAGIPLPAIVKPLTINGYTQTGASVNTLANADNAVILIELNGTGAGTAVNGLTLGTGSAGSTIEGLMIDRFQADASFNGGVGILVQSNGNKIVGNVVGLKPNGGDGIRIVNASTNIIGGTNLADRNIVSGNTLDGIHIEGTLATPATGNLIQGNFIGVAADGKTAVGTRTVPIPNAGALGTPSGNFLFGIEISGGNNNTVGGTTAGARNVVGFNADGIEIDNGGQSNLIQGNFSGVGADGVTPVGNLQHGIVQRSSNTLTGFFGPAQANEPGVSFNLIGGTVAGAGNLVEFNGTGGVAAFANPVSASGQPNISNTIEGNSIFQNGRGIPTTLLGIDLTNKFVFPRDDGLTANDSQGHGAPNTPNNFQNFPVLTSVMPGSGNTAVAGTLRGAPNSTFRIEFFANNADPGGGITEGQQFLGFVNATADANGNATFSVALSVQVALGLGVTATATDAVGNTSEFSAATTAFTASQRFVQALYQDELGRSGNLNSPADAGGWVTAINNQTLTLAAVAAGIERSHEARNHLVTGWYQSYLGRLPLNGEEQGWVNLLQTGQTEENVLSGILGSQEVFNRANSLIGTGTPSQRYIQSLYLLLLNRTGSVSEVAAWVNALPQMFGQGVSLSFLGTTEYRTDVVSSYFTTLLHRQPDPFGLVGWVQSGLGIDAIRLSFESSPEFFSNG